MLGRIVGTRWIYTIKGSPEGRVVKAQLVAKRFQDADVQYIRSDSPTCAKESLHIMLTIITSFGWCANVLDIKTAFLQRKSFAKTIFVTTPTEADNKQGY